MSTGGGVLARLGHALNRALPGLRSLLPKPVKRWILLRVLEVNRDYESFADLASRRFLEHDVLPWLRETCPRILFVGTGPYTVHYEKLFARTPHQYVTIDSDPAVAVWGARDHIVAQVQEIGRHRPDGHFDAVVLNGVFGFGVDDPPTMRAVAAALHAALRPGGRLVLGWNSDVHAAPEELGVLDEHFAPDRDSPWGFRRTFPGEFHVNDFYVRRA
ncbi:MAG: methyltransferase domain-containing protein [Enhydrobacter sp.]|nr:MAG: methyltransferase domain-containing protein [Enhydrobacter sp.]